MNKRELEQQRHMFNALESLGIGYDDRYALRRISMTLRRWFELECGDSNDFCSWAIERDDKTEKPYMVRHLYAANRTTRNLISDRETGARTRLAEIMVRYPALSYYVQTDPRGAALYILRPGDVPDGERADAFYTRGICIW